MADFAPNFTCRLKFTYAVLGLQHTLLWRLPRGTVAPNAWVTKFQNFLSTFSSLRYTNFTIIGAEFSEEDSDFFVPTIAPTPDAGSLALPTQFISESTAAASFVGRSSAGHKAKFHLFGTAFTPEGSGVTADNFRLTTSEVVLLGSAIGDLNAAPVLVANDNNPVSWYPYVNSKYMDHWVKAVRG